MEEDNLYIVKLKPDEFNELYDEYTTFFEWSHKHIDERQKALAERVIAALQQADTEHVCLDEIQEGENNANLTCME